MLEVPVTAVEPIVQYVTRKIPHETCWDERVRVNRAAANHSATPGILGAVVDLVDSYLGTLQIDKSELGGACLRVVLP